MKKTVRDIEVKGKRALVRCDFNVPQDEQGRITDERRIEASLPTIRYLMERGAKVILMSHLGRPKGKRDPAYSLAPVAEALGRLLGMKVALLPDCVGPQVEEAVSKMKEGDVVLLENVRFHPEEEKNDEEFARKLARLGDFYVNDAFATAHRANSSTEAVARFLKPAVAGLLMEKELTVMGKALESPERPVVALLGGAKVSDKIPLIENLLTKVDTLLIGGAMSHTFMKAKGWELGNSLLEEECVDVARSLMERAEKAGVRLLLPVDVLITKELKPDAQTSVVPADQIPADMRTPDIGPKTVEMWGEIVRQAKTVLWNGPMGVFEYPPFASGTRGMAAALASSNATTIVGGGETAEAVDQMGFADKMTHVSTGGGASIEFWAGNVLPGVAVLDDK